MYKWLVYSGNQNVRIDRSDLCIKYDVLCISDDVYEWLVYNGSKQVRIDKSDLCIKYDFYVYLIMCINGLSTVVINMSE